MSVAPLNLSWATAAHVRGTSRALGEPEWLTADRLAALERVAPAREALRDVADREPDDAAEVGGDQ